MVVLYRLVLFTTNVFVFYTYIFKYDFINGVSKQFSTRCNLGSAIYTMSSTKRLKCIFLFFYRNVNCIDFHFINNSFDKQME